MVEPTWKLLDLQLPGEEWRPVAGWDLYYEASSHGRIRRAAGSPCRYKTAKVLRQKVAKGPVGYLQVTLKNDRVGEQTVYVHSTVCAAFHGARPDPCLQCCHGDGNAKNNHKGNVRWDTRVNNEADRIVHGTHNRGERHGLSKLKDLQVLEIKTKLKAGRSQRSLAKEYGVSQSAIYDIKTGKRWIWCTLPVGASSPVSIL